MASALWQVEVAFVAHQVPDLLQSGSPGQGPVVLAEADAATLARGLGESLGTPQDVRALTPRLLRAVVDRRIDLRLVLARIAMFWDRWSTSERAAVRDFVDTLWVALLDRHPGSAPTSPAATAASFLDDVAGLSDGVGRQLGIWEYKDTAIADHHLAELVIDAHHGARVAPEVLEWVRDRPQRERLQRAARRDRDEPWAGALATALALLAGAQG